MAMAMTLKEFLDYYSKSKPSHRQPLKLPEAQENKKKKYFPALIVLV